MKCPKCGCEVKVSASEAGKALGRVVTEGRIRACRENAKKPRPSARGPRKQKTTYELVLDLPYEEKRQLAAALLQMPRPYKKRGRPPKGTVREVVGDDFSSEEKSYYLPSDRSE